MRDLLDTMAAALRDLLQTGYRTASPAAVRQFRTISADCEAAGLHTGAGLMESIAGALDARQHAFHKNDLELTDHVSRTVRYIELCRQHLTEDAIRQRWQGGIK